MRKPPILSFILLLGSCVFWILTVYASLTTIVGVAVVWIAVSDNMPDTEDYVYTALVSLLMTLIFGLGAHLFGRRRREVLSAMWLLDTSEGSGLLDSARGPDGRVVGGDSGIGG
jgi:signal transduction histidine kinase